MSSSRPKPMFLLENSALKFRFKPRSMWVHDINECRDKLGEYHHLMPQLRSDEQRFHDYLRMGIETFDNLLEKLRDDISKKDTNFRRPIPPEERLVITIRYLATGNSFHSLAFSFRLGVSTVGSIVKQVCTSILKILQPLFMPPLSRDILCLRAADEFSEMWQFPNCFGTLDGKHIRIKCPENSGSMFYNYKKYFSIVLQGVADAKCRFLAIDVGAGGKQSDGGVLQESSFYQCLQRNAFDLPPYRKLPDSNRNLPMVILGDEPYPLEMHIMRPFPQRNLTHEKGIFNYRLSRARRSVECAFGILSNKFRIIGRAIDVKPETVDIIVKSVCVLHNMIIETEGDSSNVPESTTPSDTLVSNVDRRAHTRQAGRVREEFMLYFFE